VISELVHPKAVAVGAGVALAVCVPAAILAQVLDDAGTVDDDSSWLLVLFGVILVGMGIGGFVAANRRLDAPLTNGAVAALAAYLLVQTIGAVRLLATGGDVTWIAIPFFALLSSAAGMTGGLVADHRARQPR
jgi:cadmium resistance protein CadD (predicted permease)